MNNYVSLHPAAKKTVLFSLARNFFQRANEIMLLPEIIMGYGARVGLEKCERLFKQHSERQFAINVWFIVSNCAGFISRALLKMLTRVRGVTRVWEAMTTVEAAGLGLTTTVEAAESGLEPICMETFDGINNLRLVLPGLMLWSSFISSFYTRKSRDLKLWRAEESRGAENEKTPHSAWRKKNLPSGSLMSSGACPTRNKELCMKFASSAWYALKAVWFQSSGAFWSALEPFPFKLVGKINKFACARQQNIRLTLWQALKVFSLHFDWPEQ